MHSTRVCTPLEIALFLACRRFLTVPGLTMPDGTIVQLEHLDDGEFPGAGGLWGLVEGQYVVVWLISYEMNLELESIWQFREIACNVQQA